MCLIFEGSSLAFGASYQSFLIVCWFLPLGVTNFAYPSEKFNNPTDVNSYVDTKLFIFPTCLLGAIGYLESA